MKPLIESP